MRYLKKINNLSLLMVVLFTLLNSSIKNRLSAQTISFEEVTPSNSVPKIKEYLRGVSSSSVGYADVENDGDVDILISGYENAITNSTSLYINDGSGGFTKATTFFPRVSNGSMAFADVDGDNDSDLILTGYDGSDGVANLYLNNGSGIFFFETAFPGFRSSSVKFFDYDNDSDLDLILSGYNDDTATRITSLYSNDGNGVFALIPSTPFDGVSGSDVIVGDVNSDGYQDIFLTGFDGVNAIANLFINNGNGTFSKEVDMPFAPVYSASSMFADVDGDNDLDLFVAGRDLNGILLNLYINEGNLNFSAQNNLPFEAVSNGTSSFEDVDGDNDLDLFISGYSDAIAKGITKLYLNDGSGFFNLVEDSPMEDVWNGTSIFTDIDGDNDKDIVLTGFNNDTERNIAKMYYNDGNGRFSLVTNSYSFEGATGGTIAFADFDGDNQKEILITGENNAIQTVTRKYEKDDEGNYRMSKSTNSPFPGVSGELLFADIDGDNDLDVIQNGDRVPQAPDVLEVYRNEGNGVYSLISNPVLKPLLGASVAMRDFDGDNDLDLWITGLVKGSGGQTEWSIYENDGTGNFFLAFTVSDGLWLSSLTFGDLDGDGDEDFIMAGRNSNNNEETRLYMNVGVSGGAYFYNTVTNPFNIGTGNVAMEDVDNDNDLDVLANDELYINDGTGAFTFQSESDFSGATGFINFSDIDNDNDKDVLVGKKLYVNNGSGVFSISSITAFDSIDSASKSFFEDIDGDNDLDVVIIGIDASNNGVVKLFVNNSNLLSIESLNNNKNGLKIYPNPVVDIMTFDSRLKVNEIRVFSSLGKEVMNYKIVSQNSIDASLLQSGIYILKVSNSQSSESIKFIKH